MPIWINAVGIGCMGCVYGYVLFYSFKRHHPPIVQSSLSIRDTVSLLAAIGVGGVLGAAFRSLEGINYVGPYGIGLLLGVMINVILTLLHESRSRLTQFSDGEMPRARDLPES